MKALEIELNLCLVAIFFIVGSLPEPEHLESKSCMRISSGLLQRTERSPEGQNSSHVEYKNESKADIPQPATIRIPEMAPVSPTSTASTNCGGCNHAEDVLEAALIPKNYTVYTIPWPADALTAYNFTTATGFPFPVYVNLVIHNIQDIDEVNQRIALELELTMYWHDYIISKHVLGDSNATDYNLHNLNADFLKRIWKPDLLFEHTTSVLQPQLVSRPVLLRFQKTQIDRVTRRNQFLFQYTSRLIVKLSCPMDFHFYPADTQTCSIKLRSFGYFTYAMRLYWVGAEFLDRSNENFDLKIVEATSYTRKTAIGKTGQFFELEILKIDLLARRRLSYHIVQTYLPSIFFIIITWICFLVPSEMVEARIGISMTTLLTLTSMFASVRESSPIISYVKALDIWMVALIFFVFLTLLQFTVLIWLKHSRVKQKKRLERALTSNAPPTEEDNGIKLKQLGSRKRRESRIQEGGQLENELEAVKSEIDKSKAVAKFLEDYSFWIFFVLFVTYIISYWSWLIIASGYTTWHVNTTFNPEFSE